MVNEQGSVIVKHFYWLQEHKPDCGLVSKMISLQKCSFQKRNAEIAYVTAYGANILDKNEMRKKALLGVYAKAMVTIQK